MRDCRPDCDYGRIEQRNWQTDVQVQWYTPLATMSIYSLLSTVIWKFDQTYVQQILVYQIIQEYHPRSKDNREKGLLLRIEGFGD